MKAVIMAGGLGSRLRPLTCTLPKPMARLCGRPVLHYILELIGRHGCTEAAITLGYQPQAIAGAFPDGRFGPIRLTFCEEPHPLGTAGSVKNALSGDEEEILVISGDALCDFDLSAALRRHRESGADATLLVKRVTCPTSYGLVLCDGDGRVTGFVEKPAFSQAVSELANTGVYILSARALARIPSGVPYDFAGELFPDLLASGELLCALEQPGYWCDIGDIDAYLRCQRDLLEGRVQSSLPRDERGSVIAPTARLGDCVLDHPVYIGEYAQIADGARVGAGSVLDRRVTVGEGCRVTGGVLLPGAHMDANSTLTGALLCTGSLMGRGSALYEGAVLGEGACLGAGGSLQPGVRVWPGKQVPPGAQLREHLKTGAAARGLFGEEGRFDESGAALTPEACARLGAALGSANPRGRIGVGHAGGAQAESLCAALAAGVRSAGCAVLDFGELFGSMFDFFITYCALPVGVFVEGGEHPVVRVCGKGALPPGRPLERTVEELLARGEFVRADCFGAICDMSAMGPLYHSELLALGEELTGMAAAVRCPNRAAGRALSTLLEKLGCAVVAAPGADGYIAELGGDGVQLCLSQGEGAPVPWERLLALGALIAFERGEDAALRSDAPQAIEELARQYGRKVHRYLLCPADDSDRAARSLAVHQRWSLDGLALCLRLLGYLHRRGISLYAALEPVPAFGRATGEAPAAHPARLLAGLAQGGAPTEGVLLRRGDGLALLRPAKSGEAIRVFAEAADAETAAEICGDLLQRIAGGRLQDDSSPCGL